MKITFPKFVAAMTAMLIAPCATAAAGWTDFGAISTLEQNPANSPPVSDQVFVVVQVTTNPSSCTSQIGFYFSVTDDRTKRLFAMLMSAQLAGKNVRIFATGNCHSVGYAELDGVVIQQ